MMLRIYPVVLELVRRLGPALRVLKARSGALGGNLLRCPVLT